MSDVIKCPGCHQEVSRHAIDCLSCGERISDVPTAITHELVDGMRDADLPDVLFKYALQVMEERGRLQKNGPGEREILAALPRGIRAAYTLVVLDSEVRNGGFYQWFTNSSGRNTDLTLEDLLLIRAPSHAALIGEAISLNRQLESKYPVYAQRWDEPALRPDRQVLDQFRADVKANFDPEFDRLSTAFYRLEDADSLWPRFVEYVRRNPGSCLHNRSA